MPEIKIVDENNAVVEEASERGESESSKPDGTTIPTGEFLIHQIGQTFDLKPSEMSKYKRPLNDLIEYAKTKTDDHSPAGLKWAIRSLSTKLGTPPLGEKLITYLQRYARLSLEGQKIEKEKEKFENPTHE